MQIKNGLRSLPSAFYEEAQYCSQSKPNCQKDLPLITFDDLLSLIFNQSKKALNNSQTGYKNSLIVFLSILLTFPICNLLNTANKPGYNRV